MRIGWLKLHYVWAYAILGSVLPYLSLYARQRGLSDVQVGWVYGAFGLAVLVAPPAYTALADRLANNRALITGSYLLSAATLVGLCFGESFVTILGLHLLFALWFTSIIPLLDGLTFATIAAPVDEGIAPDAGNVRLPYRAIRIFGSYGWMLPGFAFSALLLLGLETLRVSMIAIGTGAAFAACGAITAGRLPRRSRATDRRRGLPTLAALRTLRRPAVAVFVGALFMMFVSITGYFAFYPPYLEELGIRVELVGLITNLGVIVEVGCMIASNWLMRRVGVRGLLLIGAAAHVGRLVMLAGAPAPIVAVASQILHGPTVVAIYLLPPMYLNRQADPTYRNSMQGLYVMLCFGVARLAGAGIGHVSDAVGGGMDGLRAVFWTSAAIAGAATLLLAVGFRDRDADHALQDRAG
jgi:PPP family 3-phenylpropionic acid transporter